VDEVGSAADQYAAAVTLAVLATIAEAASGADTYSSALSLPTSIAETGSGTDTVIGGFGQFPIINEAGSGADTYDAFTPRIGVVHEFADAAASEDTTGTFQQSIAEAVIGEAASAGLNPFDILMFEGASALAVVSVRGIWEDIDATQNPNWVDITAA
jgi:hypothetical protein